MLGKNSGEVWSNFGVRGLFIRCVSPGKHYIKLLWVSEIFRHVKTPPAMQRHSTFGKARLHDSARPGRIAAKRPLQAFGQKVMPFRHGDAVGDEHEQGSSIARHAP